uniref:C2H2-type domain-containing protein n=1 Tax=Phlebotomus papatasi TaxID=29031 RepID=A0A1B0DNG1_PHLPP
MIQDQIPEVYKESYVQIQNPQAIQQTQEIIQFVITEIAEIRERKHVCKFCSKAFTQYSSLSEHVVTHSAERNYKCSLCPAAFKSAKRLKRHTAETHSEGFYPCTICNKSFPA